MIKELPRTSKPNFMNILKPNPATKVYFEPLMRLDFEGSGLLATIKSPDFVEIVFGITKARMSSIGQCVCGVADHPEDAFFEAGLGTKRCDVTYLKGSLFDAMSDENQGRQRQFLFNWEQCIEREFVARNENFALWDKYGAFMVHSLYMLALPSDYFGTFVFGLQFSLLSCAERFSSFFRKIVRGQSYGHVFRDV